ncbi:MAG: hypothetical protein ACR2M1_08680 [Gemmatimonadaceae bacterium]
MGITGSGTDAHARGVVRSRKGFALIDTLAACVLLLMVFAMASSHLAEWAKRVSDSRTALVQMAIPRRALLAIGENTSATLPTGTTVAQFDTVQATYTRITNSNAVRIPRYRIILADTRPEAAIRPDTFEVDVNPYVTVSTGFDSGDTRP